MATAVFRALLLETIPHLRAFARVLTRDRDTADDLVQDAVTRALTASDQFTEGTNFKAWMFTILRNAHVNNLRRNKYRFEPLDEAALSKASTPATQDTNVEFTQFVEIFGRLRPEYREVLILVGATGLSYEEAAAICGCAVGTIKSRLSRARRDLASRVGEADGHLDKTVQPDVADEPAGPAALKGYSVG
ncbi:MAG: sigma-70 family RNA polymerase sigma factor [Inquilinaceae bacterium]